MWRVHFLGRMSPKFMPPHWDVNHRIREENRRLRSALPQV